MSAIEFADCLTFLSFKNKCDKGELLMIREETDPPAINLPKISERTHAWTLEERRAFIRRPKEERDKMLAEMADMAASYYEEEQARKERELWQAGDIIAYSRSQRSELEPS
jgi:hypothetical protein